MLVYPPLRFASLFLDFCFNLLYAISADDTGQEMREIHKFKNMPWVLSLSLVVELLRLKTPPHTLNEPFDFGVQGIASLVGNDLMGDVNAQMARSISSGHSSRKLRPVISSTPAMIA